MNPLMAEILVKEKLQRHEREIAGLLLLKKIKTPRKSQISLIDMVKVFITKLGTLVLKKPDCPEIPNAIYIGDISQQPTKEGC